MPRDEPSTGTYLGGGKGVGAISFSVRGRLFCIDMGLDAHVRKNSEGYDG